MGHEQDVGKRPAECALYGVIGWSSLAEGVSADGIQEAYDERDTFTAARGRAGGALAGGGFGGEAGRAQARRGGGRVAGSKGTRKPGQGRSASRAAAAHGQPSPFLPIQLLT